MALAKLDQVLPPLLRERVGAVSEMTVHLQGRALPPVPTADHAAALVARAADRTSP